MSEAVRCDFSLSRRRLLSTGAAAAAATAAGVSLAAEAPLTLRRSPAANRELAKAALDCVRSGQACLQHCLAALKAGDASAATCAARVQELVLGAGALSRLAINDSRQVAMMACAVREIAGECRDACRQHAEHRPFRALADACGTCIDRCDAFVA